MSEDFNLLDEPWLPVRMADGNVLDLGLLEVFRRSGEITALAETAPPSLVAQYRMLLAITHRALSRAFPDGWKDKDRAHWYREGLPVDAICDYLEHWRDRFWLFHPEYPFMQVAALKNCEETSAVYSASTLSLEQFYGTEMFNQEVYAEKPWKSQATVRSLLGYLQFVPGGFFPGKKLKSSEKAGALVNTAAIVPIGANLSQTIIFSLHPSPGRNAEDDLPAWERAPLTLAQLRGEPALATGPNDRYTRQTRAVLLRREAGGDVKYLQFAAGFSLGEDSNAPDPMASFRAGSNALVRLTFMEGRAIWRDLPALLPDPSGSSQAAAVLQSAIGLHHSMGTIDVYQPILVAGLASDQAKLLRWRSERYVLPVALFEDAEKAQQLRMLVKRAEMVFSSLERLAADMLEEIMPREKDRRKKVEKMLSTGPFTTSYFALAERTLPAILEIISKGNFQEADLAWNSALRRGAQTAWNRVLESQGLSSRALRADAKYLSRFHGLLNKHMPKNYLSVATEK